MKTILFHSQDFASFVATGSLMNPATAVLISKIVEQVLARVYNNKYETTWQDLEPAGYLDSGYGYVYGYLVKTRWV